MRPRTLLLAAALTLALAGCGPSEAGESTPVPTPTPAPAATSPSVQTPALEESAPVGPVWTDQVFAKDFTAGDGTVVMSVEYVFPGIEEAQRDPAWQKIQDYYAAEGMAYLSDATELASYAAGDYEVAQAMGEDFLPYGESMSYRVAFQTERLASVVRSYYANSVTGAAHPANYQFSETFDLSTGDKLTLGDCFTDAAAGRERVLDLLAAKGADAGYSREALEAELNDAYFYLTEEGLVIYYQPDTLAPYAAGLLEFILPYADLGDLLALDSIPS